MSLETAIMKNKSLIFVAVSLIYVTTAVAQTFGTKQRMPRPNEYGNVEINNYSEDAGIAPVVFKHWLHRGQYTCRLCHIDLGFAMAAGQTEMREDDNLNGIYCGACHNGKEAFAAEEQQPHGQSKKNCKRCHSVGQEVDEEINFYTFTKGFPRSRLGNRVDWLKAEENGLIHLADYLEGITIKRSDLNLPIDVEIDAKVAEMPDILFSHEKHGVWSGCELCHPQIFGVKTAGTVYSMQENFEGKFCGACHGKVAFMLLDCRLCHTKDVTQ